MQARLLVYCGADILRERTAPRRNTRHVVVPERKRLVSDPSAVIDDLCQESAQLDELVAELSGEQWALDTPAPGWTVAHQIAHLAWTDHSSVLAVTDRAAFDREVEYALTSPGDFVDDGAEEWARKPPARLLADWRAGRDALADALRAAPDGARFPWYGPPMSAASMATARLMETWAHGQDVADALGVPRIAPTARLRHVARLGVRTRDFAFGVHGTTPPSTSSASNSSGPQGSCGRTVRRTRSTRRPSHRPRPRLLPARHPARPPRRPRPARGGRRRRPVARHRPGLRGTAGHGTHADGRRTRTDGGRRTVTALQGPRSRSASATPPASTATGSTPCARCSPAARSTSSPATTSPS